MKEFASQKGISPKELSSGKIKTNLAQNLYSKLDRLLQSNLIHKQKVNASAFFESSQLSQT